MSVTAPQFLEKQPGETRAYSMDFSNLMSSNETISSVSTVASELRGGATSDLTISSETISGQTVQMNIAGGTDGNVYRVEVTIITSASQILEGDGMLRVRDK